MPAPQLELPGRAVLDRLRAIYGGHSDAEILSMALDELLYQSIRPAPDPHPIPPTSPSNSHPRRPGPSLPSTPHKTQVPRYAPPSQSRLEAVLTRRPLENGSKND